MKSGAYLLVAAGLVLLQPAAEAKTLTFCAAAGPEGFDPAPFAAAATFDATRPIYNRLVQYAPGTNKIAPALATAWEVSIGVTLTICSAEDLLVHKVFAGRDRDWADVESILARQLGNLNLAQVRRELPELLELKGEPESMERLERLIELVTRRRTSSDDE